MAKVKPIKKMCRTIKDDMFVWEEREVLPHKDCQIMNVRCYKDCDCNDCLYNKMYQEDLENSELEHIRGHYE